MQRSLLKVGAVIICAGVMMLSTGYAREAGREAHVIKVSAEEKAQDVPIRETREEKQTYIAESNTEDITEEVAEEEVKEEKIEQRWSLNAKEEYLIAKMAMAEAEGEDVTGKALVIMVILNRMDSESFPDTVEKVLSQKNAFTSYSNGRYEKAEPDSECWEALDMVESGWDESEGATFFEAEHNPSTWHRDNLQYLFQHGNHIFYKAEE